MRLDGLDHRVRVVHLHADDPDLGPHGLDVIGHTADQPAAANRHKHRIELVAAQALQLPQDFHGNRALSGNHVGVVERVHEGQALFLFELERVAVSVRVAVAKQHHFATQALHRVNLELWGGGGHHDHSAHAQALGTHGHALRVVAGRRADYAAFQLRRRQVCHLVVCPPQLEAEDGLLVFTLQEHPVLQALAQVFGRLQGGLHGHVVHTGGEDFFQVIGGGEWLCHGAIGSPAQQSRRGTHHSGGG